MTILVQSIKSSLMINTLNKQIFKQILAIILFILNSECFNCHHSKRLRRPPSSFVSTDQSIAQYSDSTGTE
ncbi:hypothetical protein DERP_003425 [Dermatophagoides pteronyssinus]|uniref:Uncharacterized protein n=1 Tax=Dermatophagoides pteronyssinus TaxID=6956 RepID=A0ABQ8JK14_DERPT|nr:hypothetical protein DERP_003425 [Dermatophagoides pteronyssinus]